MYILYFIMTLTGAIITQLFSFNVKTVGATPFLKQYCPNKSDTWYFRANSIVLVLAGTLLSFIILEPDSVKTSLFAGLTWCGTLQSLGLVKKKD